MKLLLCVCLCVPVFYFPPPLTSLHLRLNKVPSQSLGFIEETMERRHSRHKFSISSSISDFVAEHEREKGLYA